MRAAFGERNDVDLRQSTGLVPVGGPSERGGVLRRVRYVKKESVDRHQPPGTQPGTLGPQPRDRHGDTFEQQLQGRGTEPGPCLRDRPGSRDLPVALPVPQPHQPAGEFTHDFFIVIIEEQAHRHSEVDHDPGRQQPGTPFLPFCLHEYLVDEISGDDSREHTDRDTVGQPLVFNGWQFYYLTKAYHTHILSPGRLEFRRAPSSLLPPALRSSR